ncbi:hypothetical protein ABH933_001252 [Nocardia sp. GP40]|uniref:hypothetical protein n=1 Tax=Nocardia sp. GP40 TaxID=3156268 RepID=UPI003D260D3F
MSIDVLPTRPDPAVTDDFRARCRLYRSLYGYTWYDDRTRSLTVRAHRIRAVIGPADLGTKAYEALRNRDLPIVTIGSTERWMFLTQPPAESDDLPQLELQILRTHVTAVGPGAELALPTPGRHLRHWKCGLPDQTELPTYAEVVRALTQPAGGRNGC